MSEQVLNFRRGIFLMPVNLHEIANCQLAETTYQRTYLETLLSSVDFADCLVPHWFRRRCEDTYGPTMVEVITIAVSSQIMTRQITETCFLPELEHTLWNVLAACDITNRCQLVATSQNRWIRGERDKSAFIAANIHLLCEQSAETRNSRQLQLWREFECRRFAYCKNPKFNEDYNFEVHKFISTMINKNLIPQLSPNPLMAMMGLDRVAIEFAGLADQVKRLKPSITPLSVDTTTTSRQITLG